MQVLMNVCSLEIHYRATSLPKPVVLESEPVSALPGGKPCKNPDCWVQPRIPNSAGLGWDLRVCMSD